MKLLRFGVMYGQYRRVLRRVQADASPYTDTAMTPADGRDVDRLELFRSTAGGHRVAEKQRRRRASASPA